MPHMICMEIGQLDPTVVSIQIGHDLQIQPTSCSVLWGPLFQPILHCWALNPITSEPSVSSPGPLGGSHSEHMGASVLFLTRRAHHLEAWGKGSRELVC